MDDKIWIVLYCKGGRVGSFTIDKKEELQRVFHYCLIQRDVDGSEHWNVYGLTKYGRKICK